MYQMTMYEILISWCVYSLTCCINTIREFHFFMNIVIWYGNMKLCICCIVLFISSHILVCYLFTNVDVFQYSWVGLWIVVLHFMFYHDIWYSSLIYFGISLYVFILIRKLYHKVHFDKCKCTMWSLIKNCLDLLLLMCSLLLFDIVKGEKIWMHKLKMIKTHYGINSGGACLFD